MEPVTISPKFQAVIPKHIRESLKLAPGQKVQAIVYEQMGPGSISPLPARPRL